MTDQDEPQEEAPVLAPDLAQVAIEFLDRSPIRGFAEAQALLHLRAVLESIARHR